MSHTIYQETRGAFMAVVRMILSKEHSMRVETFDNYIMARRLRVPVSV